MTPRVNIQPGSKYFVTPAEKVGNPKKKNYEN
jgi:hypothetical protein